MLHDAWLVLVLIFMEGILSVDNAIVLAMLVSDLPKDQQKKALRYGMAGAFLFRFASLFMINLLMGNLWIKAVGGAYLLYLFVKGLMSKSDTPEINSQQGVSFWRIIITVELMDIAFSIDSILASVAVSSKFWVILTGGILGIIAMRFSAQLFVKLISRYNGLERTGNLLVGLIGAKLMFEAFHPSLEFDSPSSLEFYVFWFLFVLSVVYGLFASDKREMVKNQ